MYVSSFGFPFQSALKHFLRGHVFATVKLDHSSVIQRVGIARQNAFCAHSRIGNGQVGAGSVRGMPFLTRLRAAGFAIWPFDPPSDRTVLEIYPSLLRTIMPHDVHEFDNEHERDAVCSAAAMWYHRESFADLTVANDPVTLLEGDVWTPPGVMVPA